MTPFDITIILLINTLSAITLCTYYACNMRSLVVARKDGRK